MGKNLTVEYEGKEYCLEYTRKSIEHMEKRGFVASDITTKPMSTLPALFEGAFYANHRYVDSKLIDKIFCTMRNKTDLIEKLAELYNEPIKALIDEPEEAEGNATWTANW